MLITAFSAFANDTNVSNQQPFALGYHVVTSHHLPASDTKDCSISVSAQVVVGSVQCTIQVTASGSTCAEATTSAINQLNEAKRAIQSALE